MVSSEGLPVPPEVEQRIGDVTRGFFRGKLRVTPRAVEVGRAGDALVVRIKGFLAEAERAILEQPKDRQAIHDYYLRVLDQIAPLLRAGIGEAGGRPLDKLQTLLDLPGASAFSF